MGKIQVLEQVNSYLRKRDMPFDISEGKDGMIMVKTAYSFKAWTEEEMVHDVLDDEDNQIYSWNVCLGIEEKLIFMSMHIPLEVDVNNYQVTKFLLRINDKLPFGKICIDEDEELLFCWAFEYKEQIGEMCEAVLLEEVFSFCTKYVKYLLEICNGELTANAALALIRTDELYEEPTSDGTDDESDAEIDPKWKDPKTYIRDLS